MEKDRSRGEETRDASPYYSAVAPYGELAVGDAGFGLADLVGLLRRNWEILTAIMIAGTALAAGYRYIQPSIYTTTATLLIEPENRVVDLDSVVNGVGSDAIAIETQINLLHSRGFLEDFIQSRQDQETATSQQNRALERLKFSVSDSFAKGQALATEHDQRSGIASKSVEVGWDIESLSRDLSVTQQGRSFLINIEFSSTNPEEAAAVANSLARHYIAEQTDRRRRITSDASNVLSERLAALKDELLDAEEAVEHYRRSNLLMDAGNIDVTSEQIAELTSLLVEARANRMEKEARIAYINQLRDEGGSLDSLTEVIQSPHMASLWDSESKLRSQSAELRLEFGEKHPRIKSIEAERTEIKQRIDWEIDRVIANTGNELDVLLARENSLNADIKKMTSSSNQSGIQLRILEGDVTSSRRIYEDFLVRFKQTRQQEAVIQANTRLVAEAQIPIMPSNQSPLTYALLGFVGSSVLGCGLAYLRDRADRSLKSAKEITNELGLPCLGLVPFMSKRKLKGGKVHEYLLTKPVSVYAESIRSVYTKLYMMDPDSAPQVIQVTSSLPQEGKTTFAVSLATLLALDGKKTILLDLDLRHPSVGREIVLDDCMSADDFLRGNCRFCQSMVQRNEQSGCHILGVKSAVDDPTRLLRSKRLVRLMGALRAEYDQIIIDGAPSLGLSDSKALLTHTDALLFIVHWNETSIDNAAGSIEELQQCNARIAGAVLTQVNLSKQKRFGYGGLDSYYGDHANYYKN